MKKNRVFMMETLAVMLAFGLVLAGCKTDADDDNGGPGGITLEGLAGEYSFRDNYYTKHTLSVTVTGSTLTLTLNETTIPGVTIATGGSAKTNFGSPGTWVYLVNSKSEKIGVAFFVPYSNTTDKNIYLGKAAAAEFEYICDAKPEVIKDDIITCSASD
jgi:hypothetical protein